MEESNHFNKTIYNYNELDVDDARFEVISDITHHFRISKKNIYIVDLREVENFFYDGTWFYVYISEKMMLYDHQKTLEFYENLSVDYPRDFDFNRTIESFNKHTPFFKLIELNSGKILFHRVKKTPEEIIKMLDIVWSGDGGWSFDYETITSSLM